jgi:hypothetical protein
MLSKLESKVNQWVGAVRTKRASELREQDEAKYSETLSDSAAKHPAPEYSLINPRFQLPFFQRMAS